MKVQKITEIWLIKKHNPRPIDLVQYDTGIQLVFALQDFTLPDGTSATLYVQKPSGKFVYQETGITASEKTITIDLENQAITEHGNDVPYQVELKNGSDAITTFAGIFRVEKSLKNAGATESRTVIAAFEAKTAEQIAQIEAAARAESELQKQAIEAKGAAVLETIPDDYTALSGKVDTNTRTKGDAIVCSDEGESVFIPDSSDDPLRGLRLFGKSTQDGTPTPENPVALESVGGDGSIDVDVYSGNLILYPYNGLTNNSESEVTWTINNDRSISVSGTPTGQRYYAVVLQYKLQKGFYTVSGCPSGGAYQKYWIYVERKSDGYVWYEVGNGTTFEVTEDGLYDIVVNVGANAGTISNLTFYPMLNTGTEALQYETYAEVQSLEISTPNGLPGIPVSSGGNYTDASGQQWICDEVDLKRGVYVQRVYGEVFDGSDDEIISIDQPGTSTYHYTIRTKQMLKQSIGLCSHYPLVGVYSQNSDEGFCPIANSIVRIRWGEEKTLDGFKAELQSNPVSVLYALVTPIETALTTEEIQAFKALHSNYPHTTILNDAGAWMGVEYNADTKLYIDRKIAALIQQ